MNASPGLCPICGQSNQCAMLSEPTGGEAQPPCWCRGVVISPDVLARVPTDQINKSCICPRCAMALASSSDG